MEVGKCALNVSIRYEYLPKILVLDRNNWNYINVPKLFILDGNTWMHINGHKILVFGGARGVIVIVAGNGHGDTSSKPGRDWLHFTYH